MKKVIVITKDIGTIETCSLTSYRYHIRNKDSRSVYLYSCKGNYPRKIIGVTDEFFSTKFI